MDHEQLHPDTAARTFDLIKAYSEGQVIAGGQITELIPPDEMAQVANFALGMLGGFYRTMPTVRTAIDIARRVALPPE